MRLSEDLFDQNIELDGPQTAMDNMIASQVLDLIKDKVNIIEKCNSFKQYLIQSNKNNEILPIIDKLAADENLHIGSLQEILKVVSPNAENIELGGTSTEEELNN